ncbi:peptidoglycan-binding domain-containing protein [Mesorhizobium sp. LHD-90]|uniref:peptidoglycan-binding domain-containing protein n=1 Tax=Mesorhizobium sp. LHD-90 TaxID=3071414 RepID=UPI0027E1DE34|nr:peptidoglycan-binding domain-containing protein [Mesorhizobium sp. LHD-90]MDQ6436859.1 peptidoglycan-binding domain-containing protein [Mesorhizobium sp. LHD-90]
MARSAKQAKRAPAKRASWLGGVSALGAVIARNPVIAGGSTAFLVAFCYVSANAIWYQPFAHRGAIFPTREFVRTSDADRNAAEPETTFLIERPPEKLGTRSALPAAPKPAAVSDPATAQVQGVLKELGFYDGTVDGLSGPATARAIDAYRAKVGLTGESGIDEELLVQLGIEPTTAGIRPSPAPRPAAEPKQQVAVKSAPAARPEPAVNKPDDTVRVEQVNLTKKVQSGLKAFGNDGIDVDGMMGTKTRNAIREFQSIFGLPVTGEPDEKLYRKMRELGYVK